ncbi:hypothetical protein ACIRG5_27880 [Lentzea sp. NPDC102401]|uniref:hypothetical protein n=1 Tax=Lentzea sp. NPDC102401 TaxID=3364128 RepID=UPI0037FE7AE4
MADLAGPLLVGLFPPLPRRPPPGDVARVTVAVSGDRPVLDLDDRRGHPFQQQPVVRDDDHRSPVLLEFVLQPGECLVVEVVGAFVEQQQFRFGRQHARERLPGPLTARW